MIVLIVSDDVRLARRLEQMCRQALGAENATVRVAPGKGGAAAWADEVMVDLLLLDLNLHGLEAGDLLARSVAGPFHTVVISASVEHALQAFEFGVLDFVPKPLVPERLIQALGRATDATARAGVAAKYLAVKKSGGVGLIAVHDLVFVRRHGATTELGLADGRIESHDKAVDRLEAILPPVFERVNEGGLVRWSAVREWHAFDPGGDGEVELENGVRLHVSAVCQAELRDKLCGEPAIAR